MAIDDEDAVFSKPKPKAITHVIGEPLDSLSADELRTRIAILRSEIERLEAAIAARAATQAAAEAFFKS